MMLIYARIVSSGTVERECHHNLGCHALGSSHAFFSHPGFRLAKEFAESKTYNDTEKVVISGKQLDLTCSLVQEMQPVPIVKADVTEVGAGQADDAPDENEELQRALRLSLGNAADDDTAQSSHKKVDQSLEAYVDSIFSSVCDLLSHALAKNDSEPRLGLMLSLLIDLVHHSHEHGGKLARAKKLAIEITTGAARLVSSADTSSKEFARQGRPTLIMCLVRKMLSVTKNVVCYCTGRFQRVSSLPSFVCIARSGVSTCSRDRSRREFEQGQ